MSTEQVSTFYVLRHKDSRKYLSPSVSSNDGGEFCGDTTTTLYADVDDVLEAWRAEESAEHAEYVRQHSTPWYNSSMLTPKHEYEPDELEVCVVSSRVTISDDKPHIPSPREFFNAKYGPHGWEPNAGHLNMLYSMLDARQEITYDYYDLRQYLSHAKAANGT